jgi:hypothetical protein
MAAMRLWERYFASGGTLDIFTNDLCAKLSTATPHANSPSPEFALEIAPPIHPGFFVLLKTRSHSVDIAGQERVYYYWIPNRNPSLAAARWSIVTEEGREERKGTRLRVARLDYTPTG